jgi:pimeloyl-ACP methyl ester carboxylesterase
METDLRDTCQAKMTTIEKEVELAGRATLRYVERGDPAGIPVLLLHGVTDSWHSFEPLLPLLPTSIHAFALSQRGHGNSERPARGYRTRDFAEDIAGFMDAVGLRSAIIVGHSMGATHAQRFAIDHPQRVAGLVLVGAFATYRGNAVIVDLWRSTVSRLADPVDAAFVREFQESTLAHAIPQPFLDAVVAESLKLPARVWRDAFAGFLEDDFADELGAIAAPTLLVWGERDTLVPRHDQERMLRCIPDAKLAVYEGAGHAVHWEEPLRFAADLGVFAGEERAFLSIASVET